MPPQAPGVGHVAPLPADPASAARAEAARGDTAMARGDLLGAVAHFRQAVEFQPAVAAYHLKLGVAAERAYREELVERHLLEAARLEPGDFSPHVALAAWHYRQGRLDRALEHADAARALAPNDRAVIIGRANILLAAGKGREAWEAMRPLADTDVPDRWVAQLCSRAAGSVGKEAEALQFVERALRAPDLTARPDGKPMLHFAASALLDKMGRYDEAFEQARLGNELVRTAFRAHEPATHVEWVDRQIAYYSPRRIKALPRATHDSRRPVFVLGMPRSGTTLVEQVLACHPQVHGAGELNALRLAARDAGNAPWAGAPYPEALDGMSMNDAERLAAQYLAAAAPPATSPDMTYVTDKQPLNFLLLGLVEVLFPRAHVIHCVRNPLDTCLSCFLTNFEQSNQFKFDLGHLGGYFREYRRLMDHWKKVLTVPILEVRYEEVVLDTEGQARRMLDFLELPWDDRCLRYHESGRRVRTASVDQVKRPIYTSSIGRWKHYEKHLASLIAALGRTAPAPAPTAPQPAPTV